MQKLRKLRDALRDAIQEEQTIGKMSAEAQREVDEILADGKIGGDDEQKRYATAALTLQMLPSRIAHLKKTLAVIQADAEKELSAERQLWNRRVRTKSEQCFEQVCAALRPFFDGDVKSLKRAAESLAIPALHRIGKASSPAWTGHSPSPEVTLQQIESFEANIKRYSELIGN